MDDYREKQYGGWSLEEDKLFETALAVIDDQEPEKWEAIANMVGGKSADEVEKHYNILLEDLQLIESGKLDHTFEEAQHCHQADCTGAVCWTDEDDSLLSQLDINRRAAVTRPLDKDR